LSQRGFTMIELLIAITMLAVIISIMGGALSLAYHAVEKGEKKIEYLEREKNFYSLIESQIQSAFASNYNDQGEIKSRFSGLNNKMAFASNYSLWRGTRGNCLVKYEIETDDRRKSVFHIEEQVLGSDVKHETQVTTDHDAIRFEYYLENALEEGKWVDEWPAEERSMPQKMRVHFTDKGNDRVLAVNVFAGTVSSPTGLISKPVVTK
jgi:general secretion pathway protein J